jgi:hypothetical protein
MQWNDWSESMQAAWHEFETVVIEAGQRILGHLPPTLKAEVTTLDAVETVTRKITQTLGHALAQGWTQEIVQTADPPSPPSCPVCATTITMRKIGPRSLTKLGFFGAYTWSRAYYVCSQGHGGVAPMDAVLRIGPERYTPSLAEAVTAFAVNLSFDQIPPLVNTLIELPLDGDTIRRVVERVGQVAEIGEQSAIAAIKADMVSTREESPPTLSASQPSVEEGGDPPQALAPEAMIVSVDGAMAPFRVGHAYHEVKVGVCLPLGRGPATPSASPIPVWQPLREADYCLGLEARPDFWPRVRAHALALGLDAPSCQTIILLGDGADWIWRYGAEYLGRPGLDIIEGVDIYHARGHLWDYAKAYFANEADETAWAQPLHAQLAAEGPAPIIAAMTALEAQAPGADPTAVAKEHGYFVRHAAQMDYPRYRALGLPIGSGIVEGACRTLVKERLDGGGMWWTRAGAQTVGTLRALYRSGFDRWHQFWAEGPYATRRPELTPDARSELQVA